MKSCDCDHQKSSILDSVICAWTGSTGWVKAKVWDSWDWKENINEYEVRKMHDLEGCLRYRQKWV